MPLFIVDLRQHTRQRRRSASKHVSFEIHNTVCILYCDSCASLSSSNKLRITKDYVSTSVCSMQRLLGLSTASTQDFTHRRQLGLTLILWYTEP